MARKRNPKNNRRRPQSKKPLAQPIVADTNKDISVETEAPALPEVSDEASVTSQEVEVEMAESTDDVSETSLTESTFGEDGNLDLTDHQSVQEATSEDDVVEGFDFSSSSTSMLEEDNLESAEAVTPSPEIAKDGEEVEENLEVDEAEEESIEESDDFELEYDDEEEEESFLKKAEDLPPSAFEEDDEEFLSSDKVLHQEDTLSIIQQMDNVVSWEVINFYKENGKIPNKYVMRGNPPIFKISGSGGDQAEFLVTKELSLSLSKIFGDIGKAYYGISPPAPKKPFSQQVFKEKVNSTVEWGKNNPVKVALVAILFIFFIVSVVL